MKRAQTQGTNGAQIKTHIFENHRLIAHGAQTEQKTTNPQNRKILAHIETHTRMRKGDVPNDSVQPQIIIIMASHSGEVFRGIVEGVLDEPGLGLGRRNAWSLGVLAVTAVVIARSGFQLQQVLVV